MGNGISVNAQKNSRGSRKYAWQSQPKLDFKEKEESTHKSRFSFLDFLRNKNKSNTTNTKRISTQTSVSSFNDSSDVDSNGNEDESHDDEFTVMRHLSLFDDRELTGIPPPNAMPSPPGHEVDPAASSVDSDSKKDKDATSLLAALNSTFEIGEHDSRASNATNKATQPTSTAVSKRDAVLARKAQKQQQDEHARVRELIELRREYGEMKRNAAQALHTLHHSHLTSTGGIATASDRLKLKLPIATGASDAESPRAISPVPWVAMGLARSPRAGPSPPRPKLAASLVAKLKNNRMHRHARAKDGGSSSSKNAVEAVRKSKQEDRAAEMQQVLTTLHKIRLQYFEERKRLLERQKDELVPKVLVVEWTKKRRRMPKRLRDRFGVSTPESLPKSGGEGLEKKDVMPLNMLNSIWFEVTCLLRCPLTSQSDIDAARLRVEDGLCFIQRLQDITAARSKVGVLMGDIFQELLRRISRDKHADQTSSSGISRDTGHYDAAGARLGQASNRNSSRPKSVVENLLTLNATQWSLMTQQASALRKLVRIKLEDKNDLLTALQALEYTKQFFDDLAIQSEVNGVDGYDLVNSAV